jgi:quinol monooxygenase YgiN
MRATFGLHGSITAQPGKGEELGALLLEAAALLEDFDGCLLYVVSCSADDSDTLWVTEAWTDRDAHGASLQDERVRAIIQRARPLIAGMSGGTELVPLGGKGI